jgi:hypothetical protein
MRQSKAFVMGTFFAILTVTASGCARSGMVPAQGEATPLCEVTTGRLLFESRFPISIWGDWWASPNLERVIYYVTAGDKEFVVVDGVEGKMYDKVWAYVNFFGFSPDSHRVAYVAESGGMQFAVVDGVEGKRYDRVTDLMFSPDSQRVAYAAKVGEKAVVVVNGVEGRQYDAILFPEGALGHFPASGGFQSKILFYSPNSLRYLAVRGNGVFLVEEKID